MLKLIARIILILLALFIGAVVIRCMLATMWGTLLFMAIFAVFSVWLNVKDWY